MDAKNLPLKRSSSGVVPGTGMRTLSIVGSNEGTGSAATGAGTARAGRQEGVARRSDPASAVP